MGVGGVSAIRTADEGKVGAGGRQQRAKTREAGESRKKYKDQNTVALKKRGVDEEWKWKWKWKERRSRGTRREETRDRRALQGWLIGQSGRPEFLAIRIPSIYQHSVCNYHDRVEPSERVLELYLEIAKSNHNRRTDMEPSQRSGVHYPAPMGTRRYPPSQYISLSRWSITGHEPPEAQVSFPPSNALSLLCRHRVTTSSDGVEVQILSIYYLFILFCFCFLSSWLTLNLKKTISRSTRDGLTE